MLHQVIYNTRVNIAGVPFSVMGVVDHLGRCVHGGLQTRKLGQN